MRTEIASNRQNSTNLKYRLSPNFSSVNRDDNILLNASLVKSIAHKLSRQLPPNILLGDLIGAGVIGLIDAANKFDPNKNVPFKIYARYRIEGAMWDELRALDWLPRSVTQKKGVYNKVLLNLQKKKGEPPSSEEVARELDLQLSELYDLIDEITVSFVDVDCLQQGGIQSQEIGSLEHIPEEHENPFHLVSLREQRKILSRAIETLSQQQQMVISLYYYEGLTLKQIGKILSLTESRVCQIHRKAVKTLKVKLTVGSSIEQMA